MSWVVDDQAPQTSHEMSNSPLARTRKRSYFLSINCICSCLSNVRYPKTGCLIADFPQTVCPHWGAGSHKVWATVLGRGIFAVNFRIKRLLWHVDVHFDCAGLHKVWATALGRDMCKMALVTCWCAFRLRRLAQSLRRGKSLRPFSCNFPYKVALAKCWCAFRLRRLAQSLRRGFGARHLSYKIPH